MPDVEAAAVHFHQSQESGQTGVGGDRIFSKGVAGVHVRPETYVIHGASHAVQREVVIKLVFVVVFRLSACPGSCPTASRVARFTCLGSIGAATETARIELARLSTTVYKQLK